MSTDKMHIVGFTAPPNGTLEIDHVFSSVGQDFRTVERYTEYRECGFTEKISIKARISGPAI